MADTAWEKVMIARNMARPTSLAFINNIFKDFIELHGDRNFADDAAIVGGIATLGGRAVTIIAEEKGKDIADKTRRHFGCPHPEGYRKALRLIMQAEKFQRPIITIVDTQGAYCGTGAEERGQGEAIATNLREMMALTVPVITVIIGEGGSGGALAIAVSNNIAMLENAVYSILSPEGFATILWKDSTRAQEAAGVMKITADELIKLNVIDEIIKEPNGGAHLSPNVVFDSVKEYFERQLEELSKIDGKTLQRNRYERFRAF